MKAVIAVVLFALALIIPESSHALPYFSRQVGRDCSFCHVLFPKLNEQGRVFRSNGYRFEAEGSWKDVRDWTTFPAAMEITLNAFHRKNASSGVQTTSSDMGIDEFEMFSSGAFGKTGAVSAYGSFNIKQSDSGGTTTYPLSVTNAAISVNDLIGPAGAGALNLKAGQTQLTLPFLGGNQRIFDRAYLAETLGVFTKAARVAELNGAVVAPEESGDPEYRPTHRYSAGIVREDVNKDAKLKGLYATYTATFAEKLSLGAILRHGQQRQGAADIDYDRYGLAAEGTLAPVILDAGVFRIERAGMNRQTDYLLEALYMPMPRLSTGARLDIVKENYLGTAKTYVLMARYNILSNTYTSIEYQWLRDGSHITGSNENDRRVRLFLVSVF